MDRDLIKEGLREFLRAVAENGFKLPLRFRLMNADGDPLREFRIHRDGLEQCLPSGRKKPYVFPLVASARSADGRTARVWLSGAAGAGKVEFFN